MNKSASAVRRLEMKMLGNMGDIPPRGLQRIRPARCGFVP
jgi:hypothetical protein